MENPRAQLLERLQTANNILVTVSSNPTIDQLSAAIGLTLMLNRVGKQATAVFSGRVPSTIEFLQPEKTIEKNTDSLRDFIIALDKSKADKLRYKVEDNHVKIFITPYRTALSENDLKFSQGDFNIEVVLALGVKDQKDLDRAITAHGRILHDATTISITNGEISSIGSIDWDDAQASGLSEMVAGLASELGPNSLDGQVSTALLTGIVAQTERFRNARTLPATMSLASALMAAGANQQLIASKLEQPDPAQKMAPKSSAKKQEKSEQSPPEEAPEEDDSALHIKHEEEALPDTLVFEEPAQPAEAEEPAPEETKAAEPEPESASSLKGRGALVLEPPTLGGKLTANTEPERLDPAIDSLGTTAAKPPLLSRKETPADDLPPIELPAIAEAAPAPEAPAVEPEVDATAPQDVVPEQTLQDLEAAVQGSFDTPAEQSVSFDSAPVQEEVPTEAPVVDGLDTARDAVSDALASIGATTSPTPIAALNAQPFDINDQLGAHAEQQNFTDQMPLAEPEAQLQDFALPQQPVEAPAEVAASVVDPNAPPAVPPPFMPGEPMFGAPEAPQLPPQPGGATQQSQPTANNPFNLPSA